MTERVLDGFFTHEHDRREAAKQEYVLAKQHFGEVLENRVVCIPEHEERFRHAAERQNVARGLFVKFLTRWRPQRSPKILITAYPNLPRRAGPLTRTER